MRYYSSIIFMASLALVLMLAIVACNKNMSKEKRKGFTISYALLLVATFFEWLGECLNGVSGDVIFLHVFVKFLEFSITPFFPVVCAKVIFSTSRKNNFYEKIPVMILIFHIVLELFSLHYHFIFYVDAAGYYHHAKFYKIYVFVFIFSAIYFFVKSLLFSKYYQNRNRIILLLIVLFIILGVSIQFIDSSKKTSWLTIGISSIFIYIYYNEITMYVDHLTQLLNQRSYKNYLENISSPVSILLFDIDNFKYINDTFGHDFGDEMLSTIGKAIKEIYSRYGYCYRIGGDEFCVILTQCTSIEELNHLFFKKLEEIRKFDTRVPYMTVGSSHFQPGYQDISDVVKAADKDMYFQKNKKKENRNLQQFTSSPQL